MYEEIITDAQLKLEKKKKFYSKIRAKQDSIKKTKRKKKLDTLYKSFINLDTTKINLKKDLSIEDKVPTIEE